MKWETYLSCIQILLKFSVCKASMIYRTHTECALLLNKTFEDHTGHHCRAIGRICISESQGKNSISAYSLLLYPVPVSPWVLQPQENRLQLWLDVMLRHMFLLGATVCLYPHMGAHFRITLEKHQLFIIMGLDWLLEKQLEHLNVIQSKTTYSLFKTEAILRKKTFSTKTNKQQTVY